ncbi:uncharacterized protein [Arachis hypogaea]|uniref:uncharacterized protein n=1 Tax=Arachis hypogaea TaxID=3818 RepID=UPI000DED2895|nr:uncharacterized protein LOC112779118 [Arachis hypogaea]
MVEEVSRSQETQGKKANKKISKSKEKVTPEPTPPKEKEVLKLYVSRAPYPQRFQKGVRDKQFFKFLEIFKKLQINIPFVEALEQMPLYAKFLKELMSRKRSWKEKEIVVLTQECSAIIQKNLPQKLKDPGSFQIPCSIGDITIERALCDLGAGGRNLVENLLVKVGEFIFAADFVVVDIEEDVNASIILERPFLATSRAIIDVQKGELVLRVHEEKIVFNVFKAINYLSEPPEECMRVHVIESLVHKVLGEEKFDAAFEVAHESCNEEPEEIIATPIVLEKKKEKEEAPKLELKPLPSNLKYAFLGDDDTFPVIISSSLSKEEENDLLQILRSHKDAIGWTISDLKGISPIMCMHKILLEDDARPIVQPQRRLNPTMIEVVQK